MRAYVSDIMTTGVVTVRPDTPFREVAALLRQHRVSGLPVTADDGTVIGVVTKSDLGDVALAARRDLAAALRSLGKRDTPVLAVSSLPPPSGIGELVAALDSHRASLDVPAARARQRRLAALAELVSEHGESALRALGGRREAEKLLAAQPPGASVPELLAVLQAG